MCVAHIYLEVGVTHSYRDIGISKQDTWESGSEGHPTNSRKGLGSAQSYLKVGGKTSSSWKEVSAHSYLDVGVNPRPLKSWG